MLGRVEVRLDVLGKLAERLGFRVYRTFKGAHRHFVVVARIDQQHLRITDQRVPVLGLDVCANFLVRIDAGHTEGDDFLLQLDLGAVERLLVAVGFLVVDISQARILVKPGHQAIDTGTRAGDGAIDALFSQQQGALYRVIQHALQQRLTQVMEVRQGNEFIQRGDNDLVSHKQILQ